MTKPQRCATPHPPWWRSRKADVCRTPLFAYCETPRGERGPMVPCPDCGGERGHMVSRDVWAWWRANNRAGFDGDHQTVDTWEPCPACGAFGWVANECDRLFARCTTAEDAREAALAEARWRAMCERHGINPDDDLPF